jgi:hypothetical protein
LRIVCGTGWPPRRYAPLRCACPGGLPVLAVRSKSPKLLGQVLTRPPAATKEENVRLNLCGFARELPNCCPLRTAGLAQSRKVAKAARQDGRALRASDEVVLSAPKVQHQTRERVQCGGILRWRFRLVWKAAFGIRNPLALLTLSSPLLAPRSSQTPQNRI